MCTHTYSKCFIRCADLNLYKPVGHTDKAKFSSVKCSASTDAQSSRYWRVMINDRQGPYTCLTAVTFFLHSSKHLFFSLSDLSPLREQIVSCLIVLSKCAILHVVDLTSKGMEFMQ